MGGFEGGDEGGFWDKDTTLTYIERQKEKVKKKKEKFYVESDDSSYSIKAHAKVNIFFKITGYKNGYYTFLSRFMRVESLYDTISFIPSQCDTFTIEGCDDIPLESNSIYKAYKALDDLDVIDFFCEHKVVVTKSIPLGSGLGGGASDAAAFLRLVKEVCNLILSTDELVEIGMTIDSEIPFFIYNYPCANVSGFGETVELFEEEVLEIELYTPKIKCERSLVYNTFQQHFLDDLSQLSFSHLNKLDSRGILALSKESFVLNDLYSSAIIAYPELEKESKKDWFLSGASSSFFKLRS